MMFDLEKHITRIFYPCILWLVVLCYVPTSQLFAQDNPTAISQAADKYFEKEQFYKAAQYYQVALSEAPNDPHLNYQLASSYRELFDYPMAEIYYQKVVDLDTKNYPLAMFYHSLMQKSNGKFDQAINNFNSFLTFAERNANISLQDRSRFVAQAVVEREGCVLALEQLSYPYRDYKFTNASSTLNTRGNDYAPAMNSKDSRLTITSGRSGTRGSLQDNRFGELFTDNFRYQLDGATWKPVKAGDQFEVVNTKFNDGAGSYNAAGNKYYFTSCYGDNANCQLYVARKHNGKWQAPVLLNDQINVPDFDSKHPALSPGGDTLYFASNRSGGQGMLDLWMSKNLGGEQWAKPENLGPRFNTPFNEVSPYFHPEEDIFFFSSSGHEGLGGLDVLMVEGVHDPKSQLRNIGPPFNSSYDDAFFVVNTEKGYLASNRPGGMGKFDIYQFNAEADESIMAELSEDGKVVDREALLRSRLRQYDKSALYAARDEDQFYYDNLTAEEKLQLERILSIKMQTEGSFDPKLTLSNEDFKFYRKLSIEDKARIERMAQLRAYQAAPDEQEATIAYWANMDEQRLQDDARYYEELDAEDKVIVDRIIAAKLEDNNTFSQRLLEAEEKQYFESLSSEEKVRITRLAQLKEVNQKLEENLVVNAQNREYLSEQEQLEAQEYFASLPRSVKAKIENIIASQTEDSFDPNRLDDRELRYYNKLSSTEKESIRRLAGIREVENEIIEVAKDNQKVRTVLSELDRPEDRLYYQSLSPSDQELTDQIVQAMIRDRNTFAVRKLSPSDIHYFEGLSLKDHIRINHIAQVRQVESGSLGAVANDTSTVEDTHLALSQEENTTENQSSLTENGIVLNQTGNSNREDSLQELITVNASTDSANYPDGQLATISGQLYDLKKHGPAVNVAVPLLDASNQIVQVDTTDAQGRFEFVEVVMNQPYKIMGEITKPQLHQIPKYAVQDLAINVLEENSTSLGTNQLAKSGNENTTEQQSELVLVSEGEQALQLYENIYFDFDHCDISPKAEASLAKLVEAFQQDPQMTIEIHGHTDNTGPSDYNYLLSQKRGHSAREYLISKGVGEDHVMVVGKGEREPIASNNTSKGRSQNRRVSFYVMQTPTDAVVRSAPKD